jgi:hypothetical protein
MPRASSADTIRRPSTDVPAGDRDPDGSPPPGSTGCGLDGTLGWQAIFRSAVERTPDMTRIASRPPAGRLASLGALAFILSAALGACGSSAPATSSPSQPAASAAPPAATPAPTGSPALGASTAPSAAAVDPAIGLKIGAPYTLATLPAADEQTLQGQMAAGLGAFGSTIQTGFRQVNGGTGGTILMVIAFPTGALNDIAFQATVSALASSMHATLTQSTIGGVEVSSGTTATGGIAVFHVADHLLVVTSQTATDAVPVATALITANS